MSTRRKYAENQLINHFSAEDREWALKTATSISLAFGDSLIQTNDLVEHVYFPTTCFISSIIEVTDHQPLEMALIGNEGMLGASLALSNQYAPMSAIVQGKGTSLRIEASTFIEHMNESAAMRRIVQKYIFVTMQQLSQSSACNRFHEVSQRLARWLLMSHDRTHTKSLHLNHEFLGTMLGVRRSAVSIAAASLQKQGIISYRRGEITILHTERLEQASCDCYRASLKSYQTHLAHA
jgi:CRP-like cAMP-binding protein